MWRFVVTDAGSGPSGVGKTMTVETIGEHLQVIVYSVSLSTAF